MRVDCRHYESRTYAEGEVVRKCRIDLAPEAPWRCPDECPGYQVRLMDAGWNYGSLRTAGEAPEVEPDGQNIGALLDEAEDIVNSAAPDILAEFEPKTSKKGKKAKKPKQQGKRGWKRR